MPLSLIWYVAAGSAVGGISRFVLGGMIQESGIALPDSTLVVNIPGSFLIGLVLRYSMHSSALTPEARLLLGSGFCGGYTTFSAFSYETARLIEDGDLSPRDHLCFRECGCLGRRYIRGLRHGARSARIAVRSVVTA